MQQNHVHDLYPVENKPFVHRIGHWLLHESDGSPSVLGTTLLMMALLGVGIGVSAQYAGVLNFFALLP